MQTTTLIHAVSGLTSGLLRIAAKSVVLPAIILAATQTARAHTIQICWKDVGGVTTFYAGTYHYPYEGPSPVGGIIIDGFEYPFSGWIYPAALPADAHCRVSNNSSYPSPAPGNNPDGVPQASVVHYQTFTGSFTPGPHVVSFTSTNVVQTPIGVFPTITFGGGGACADADFDGICNNADACPLDAANDGDRDGICGNVDNCPLNANPGQQDANHNGQGDLCEGVICGNGLLQGSEQCDDGNRAGGDGCSALCTTEASDSPPNANAGVDQSVNEGQFVTLDGTLSNDPDSDPLTYGWVQIGGTSVTLTGANSSQPSFNAPVVAVGGETLSFKLTVTANGLTATDTVNIGVVNVNHPPVAHSGSYQTVAEGSEVNLDGSGSFDIDSDAFGYSWVQTAGTPVLLTGANTSTPSFTAPIIPGGSPSATDALEFSLTVDDGYSPDAPAPGFTLADVEDRVTILITNVNNSPTADAGVDQTLDEHVAVQLNGNASSDPDQDPLTYSWVQTGGPAVSLTDATTATPSLLTPFVGAGGQDLTFALTVDDGYGGSGTNTVVLHVQNANDPPNALLARPSIASMWPPNHNLVSISITGVSDPNNNSTITITSVTQDEPTNGLGDGDTAVDATINANGTVFLRAERSGKGNGRVYHVHFTAADLEGSSSGVVSVSVPHSVKSVVIDGGELFDSTH